MAEVFSELVEIQNTGATTTIRLDANGPVGDFGAASEAATLIIRDASNREALLMDGATATLRLGTMNNAGELLVRDNLNRDVFQFNSTSATLKLGNIGDSGDLIMQDKEANEVIKLLGDTATVFIGIEGNGGDLIVHDAVGRQVLSFDSRSSLLTIGTKGNAGNLSIRDPSNREVLQFDSTNAVMRIGTIGAEGDLIVRDSAAREVFHFDSNNAVLHIGANGNEGDIIVRNDAGTDVIHLDGKTGKIILENADAAEHFDVADCSQATPGMLMVLNYEGKLEPSSTAYDKKVVGVVAGAGNYRPGIVLGHRSGISSRVPISMLGKVSCKADATYGPVEVGDMLTTSPTVGHAMKAEDAVKAFGSVIGKALSPLREGVGMVDVLITLQ